MIESTDRYKALGVDPSDCKGQCEGTGVIPVYVQPKHREPGQVVGLSETDPVLLERWEKEEAENPSSDGYHFVSCPDCEGE